MSRQIRNLGVFLVVCYAALFLQVNRLTIFQADELQDKPGNNRAVERDFSRPRGTIETADGVVLAESVPSDDRFKLQRTYPTGELFGQITGYFAFQLGSTGVEKEYNDELAGRTINFDIRNISDLFVDRERVGNVVLSLRNDVQQVAKDALGDRPGAVVALDPRNGEIIAMWANPGYDPTPLASHDFQAAKAASEALNNDPAKPTLSRAFADRTFPGSTFKVVTATAGIERGGVTPDSPSYPVTDSYLAGGRGQPIHNFGGEVCGGKLFEILQVSCNTSFAQMGVENAGAENMIDISRLFGWDRDVPLDLPGVAHSVFPAANARAEPPFLAQASIGQNENQATPLQMAMVAAAVANGGKIETPHVMREVRDDQGDVVDRYEPQVWTTPMSAATAETLRQAMISVVTDGTANHLDDEVPDGTIVGGKTGTAQVTSGSDSANAWIIGFAGPDGKPPEAAVAVLVEAQEGVSEQTGGRVAAPIASEVLRQALTAPARAEQPSGGSNGGG
jgi:peptidoglycan glycosyltransferase